MTPRELKFAEAYARTGDLAYSSKKAGYASSSGGEMALGREAVVDKVADIRNRRAAKAVTIGFDTCEDVAKDRKQPGSARVSAANTLFKGAGLYNAPVDNDPNSQEFHEMTPERFAAHHQQLARIAVSLAEAEGVTVIEHEPAEPSFLD